MRSIAQMIGMGNSQRIFNPLMISVLASTFVNWELANRRRKCSSPTQSLKPMASMGLLPRKIL